MNKLSFPKINLTKKQIIIVSVSAFILIASVLTYVISRNNMGGGENDTINVNREERQEGYADDTEEALSSTWQKAYSTETDPKILVYGETSDSPYSNETSSLTLTEVCEYEDKDTEENTYTLSSTPIEVNNHCLLNLAYTVDSSETVDALAAYIVLPDNSLIALDSNGFPSIQVNIFDHETRIVQLTGSAYYRISPKENSDIFTVEIPLFSQLFTATGTEIFAEVGFTQEANSQYGFNAWEYAGGFFLYDGEGKISKRGSSEILQSMNSDDNTNIYYNRLVNFAAEKVLLLSDTLDLLGTGDFLENQKTLSEKYGFGNFSEFTTDTLKAFVYDHTEDLYAQTVTSVEQMKAEEDAKWEEMQNDDDDDTSSSGSSSGSSSDMCYSSGASYQLCRMALDLNNGSAYMSGSQCCLVSTVSEPELVPVY